MATAPDESASSVSERRPSAGTTPTAAPLDGRSDKPTLRAYQVEGVDFLLRHRRGLLAWAPGTGKTPATVSALRAAGPQRTLVVAPKSVCHHWLDMMNDWWPGLVGVLGTGTAAQREAAREFVTGLGERPVALVLNYEAMRVDVEALREMGFGAVVFDEGHRLKNRTAMQTRAANALCRSPGQWVWLVTGTPIQNRPEEIWSLLHLVDRHRYSSYWAWVRNFYETSMENYGWGGSRRAVEQLGDLRDGAIERMRGELVDVMLHRSLEELLPHLPDVTHTTIDVELDPDERALYEQLRKKVWAEIEGEILLIPNEVARMTRLRQVVSDVEILSAERERPGSKIRAAVELIDDLEPAQVIVLTWSRAAAERIATECDGVFIHGDVPAQARHDTLEGFKEGRYRVLAGTLATIGEGVDGLQVAHHLIRLDRDWTPSRNEQAVARIRRSGQASDKIFCWDLVAHDTIDAVVERALRHKQDVIQEVLTDLGR